MLLIAVLYFENQQKLYFDLTKSRMQNIASKIASKIIVAHMSRTKLVITRTLELKDYKLGFYDNSGKKVFGDIKEKIDLSKDIIEEENNFILVDKSTLGHLGIYAIAIKEHLYFKQIKELEVNIVVLLFLIYSIVALIGFYLAKLFIRPIKDERDKLNNFIKDTTHELNTPISAILMSTEGKDLNPKQIERIRLSARRVSEIYKDLTYIFLQKDIKKEDLKEIFLGEVISEQLIYFEPLANKKKIKINLDIEKYSYKIVKDDFIRVFNNLVSNAIKYNKMNGIIFITLKDNKLIIKDTGIGIKKKKIDDIFKRYYRATSLHGGFGIGLNIVYEIAKKYNIKIDVESIYNESTTITLKF
jgi:two-component system OmpR family sensor kinase